MEIGVGRSRSGDARDDYMLGVMDELYFVCIVRRIAERERREGWRKEVTGVEGGLSRRANAVLEELGRVE